MLGARRYDYHTLTNTNSNTKRGVNKDPVVDEFYRYSYFCLLSEIDKKCTLMNKRLPISQQFFVEDYHFVPNFNSISTKLHIDRIQASWMKIDKPENRLISSFFGSQKNPYTSAKL